MIGRCTTKCGDPKIWFPMRVTYQREMKVKAELDMLGIECFVPMRYQVVDIGAEVPQRELVPAINNLIFVRSTQERISELKTSNEVLEPLRYMMDHTAGDAHIIMTIPDAQMENFMRVASVEDDSVIFLGNKDFSSKIGKRVRVVGGPFEGVVGTIYRVKKDRRVVVTLDNISSVAISHINPSLLEVFDD